MGSLKDIANGAGLGEGLQCPINAVTKPANKLGANSSHLLNIGSKKFPIIKESRYFGEGIINGDLNQVAANAGLLAMYSLAGSIASNTSLKAGLDTTSTAMLAS